MTPRRTRSSTTSPRWTPARPWSTAPSCWTTASHTSVSQPRSGTVPAPVLSLRGPQGGQQRPGQGRNQLQPPARKRPTTSVRFERSISGGDWSEVGQDSSSPAYTAVDDLARAGAGGRHPAPLPGPDGRSGRGRGDQRDPHSRGRGASAARLGHRRREPQLGNGLPGRLAAGLPGRPHDAGSGGQDLAAHRGPARRQLRIQGGPQRHPGTRTTAPAAALNGSNITLDHPGRPGDLPLRQQHPPAERRLRLAAAGGRRGRR